MKTRSNLQANLHCLHTAAVFLILISALMPLFTEVLPEIMSSIKSLVGFCQAVLNQTDSTECCVGY